MSWNDIFDDLQKRAKKKGKEWNHFVKQTKKEFNHGKGIREKIKVLRDRFFKIFKYFEGHRVLVLGTRNSGKTSLIYYLTERNLSEVAPTGTPTSDGTHKVELGNNWLDIPEDIGGDPMFMPLWKKMIGKIDPVGLVYIVDGSKSNEAIQEDINQVFENIFLCSEEEDIKNSGYLNNLRVIYIFINFYDQWKEDISKFSLKDSILAHFKNELVKHHADLSIDIWTLKIEGCKTHLDPNAVDWKELDQALAQFNRDLAATEQGLN